MRAKNKFFMRRWLAEVGNERVAAAEIRPGSRFQVRHRPGVSPTKRPSCSKGQSMPLLRMLRTIVNMLRGKGERL